jgi:CBS domain-containing protein
MLAVIGAFVWLAARQESATVELRAILSGVTAEHVMIRNPEIVDASESIERAAERVLAAGHDELPVIDGGRLVGIVTATDLARALAAAKPRETVASITRTGVPVLAPDHPVAAAMETLERAGVAFIVDRDELVGLLPLDQLTTYAAFHARWTDPPARLPVVARTASS